MDGRSGRLTWVLLDYHVEYSVIESRVTDRRSKNDRSSDDTRNLPNVTEGISSTTVHVVTSTYLAMAPFKGADWTEMLVKISHVTTDL